MQTRNATRSEFQRDHWPHIENLREIWPIVGIGQCQLILEIVHSKVELARHKNIEL